VLTLLVGLVIGCGFGAVAVGTVAAVVHYGNDHRPGYNQQHRGPGMNKRQMHPMYPGQPNQPGRPAPQPSAPLPSNS
jgi:hypothetical protein